MCDEKDIELLTQMPEYVQDQIYYKFLHMKFLKDFEKYFSFEKYFTRLKYNFYSWKDQMYRDFMTQILRSLEPRREESNTFLYYELDDFSEVLFFDKGQVDIGFEINKKKRYVLRRWNNIIIADQGCTFNQNSEFIYRVYEECEGYSIRRNCWREILESDEYPELAQ